MRCALLLRNCLTVRGSFPYNPFMKFQDVILSLQRFWADRGCVIRQPYDIEVGAGTFNPATFFRVLGPEPWMASYVEPSRRPTDGRYGENPNRLQHYYQYQVIIKPSTLDIQEIYLDSLKSSGIERVAMYLQGVDNVYDLEWTTGVRYGDIHHRGEVEFSRYNFEEAGVDMLFRLFGMFEEEAKRMAEKGLVLPAYDYCLKTSHVFNLLDARGAISVTERVGYILRVRTLARLCAEGYLKQREEVGFPLLKQK